MDLYDLILNLFPMVSFLFVTMWATEYGNGASWQIGKKGSQWDIDHRNYEDILGLHLSTDIIEQFFLPEVEA